MNEVTKAKAIVALVGTIATALLGTIPPNTTLWTVLTFVVALCTAIGVHQVPNKPKARARNGRDV